MSKQYYVLDVSTVSDVLRRFRYPIPSQTRTRIFRATLYEYDGAISREDIIKKMAEDNFQPATAAELIVWAENFPWLRYNSVVALGSPMIEKTHQGYKVFFPEYMQFNDEPYFKKVGSLKDWHTGYCFLGVFK
jgi:hypothetical protein